MSAFSEKQLFVVGNSEVEIGRFSYKFENISIFQANEGARLTIGSFCSIARGLTVMLGGNHRTDWATTFPFGHLFEEHFGEERVSGHPQSNGDVVIGHDVWFGANVTIMSGISIGSGAVVATNSTVVTNIDDYEVWGGNPARLIKKRFSSEVVESLLKLGWWDLEVSKIKSIVPILLQAPTTKVLSEAGRIAASGGDRAIGLTA